MLAWLVQQHCLSSLKKMLMLMMKRLASSLLGRTSFSSLPRCLDQLFGKKNSPLLLLLRQTNVGNPCGRRVLQRSGRVVILSSAVTVDEEEEEVKGEGARVSTVQLPPLQLLFLGRGERLIAVVSLAGGKCLKTCRFCPLPYLHTPTTLKAVDVREDREKK